MKDTENRIIEQIKKKYDGRIKLNDPVTINNTDIPEEIRDILAISDGILETMINPKTGKEMTISWIVYSYSEVQKATEYYKNEYGIEGTVFSDNGAGDPYYINDGKVYLFEPIDNESEMLADSLEDFFRK